MLRVVELGAEEARVLGALVEKQLTTPQQYPLTLNALVAACNQSTNRAPVVAYDERTVEAALAALKERRLVRFVHPSHGRSATRYRQVLEEVVGLEPSQLALLGALVLRGPQTPGELRARTDRMAVFADLAAVEHDLHALAGREPPLVTRLARELGRKEVRWAQLLSGEAGMSVPEAGPAGRPAPVRPAAAGLAGEVAALRDEVAALRRDLDEVRALLGP